MSRQHCRALLIDLDGVLRRFDPIVAATTEQRYGLLAAYRYTGPQDLRYVRAALRPTVAADQPLP